MNRNPTDATLVLIGPVAVGKSTTARLLATLLARWDSHPKVDLVTTDGFLYPTRELKRRGILVARRTVAKYREAMRIPSSVQRRRDKQSMLGTALTSTSPDRSRDTATA